MDIKVFYSRTLRQEFGSAGFLIGFTALLLQMLILLSLFHQSSNTGGNLLILALIGLALGNLAIVIASRRGRITLLADRLEERNGLGRVRIFRYTQISETRPGSHKGTIDLVYHPLRKDGQIDLKRFRRTALINIKDDLALRLEIERRLPQPVDETPQLIQAI